MKNKFALILILTVLLIAVTINVALSIAVPDLMFATNGFTVAWVFTFPVNLVLTISTILYVLAKNKDFAVRFPPVVIGSCLFSAVYFVVGSIIMFTATENSGTPLVIELLLTLVYVAYLLIVGLFHTGVTYCLYFSSLKELPGQTSAILSYIDPLVAVIISCTFLQETLTWWQAVGGVLILGFTLWNEIPGGKGKRSNRKKTERESLIIIAPMLSTNIIFVFPFAFCIAIKTLL